jgi:hypothetical protein
MKRRGRAQRVTFFIDFQINRQKGGRGGVRSSRGKYKDAHLLRSKKGISEKQK